MSSCLSLPNPGITGMHYAWHISEKCLWYNNCIFLWSCLVIKCVVVIISGSFVGSGDLMQMNEYPIPHGEHCDSCILRVVNLHSCIHRADEQNALQIVSLCPPIRAKQTSSPTKARERTANEESSPNPYPNPELNVHKSPSLHLSRELLVSGLHCTAVVVAFPFSLINPTCIWTLAHKSVSCLTSQVSGL
jgi:hypothetical protein